MMKHPIRTAGLAAIALGCAAILGSCATKAPAPPRMQASPKPRLEAEGALALDQYRTRLRFELVLENPGPEGFSIEGGECLLFADGAEVCRAPGFESRALGAGSSLSIPLELVVDSRKLGESYADPHGPSAAAYKAEARLRFRDAAGAYREARAEAEGSIPLIREPRFEILALKIERDILVTTNLRLAMEVSNPNAFPVGLEDIAYSFDGELKPWAEGRTAGPFRIGARSSRRIELVFEMNFADRDRSLLDLVNKLQVVQYRLAGTASVAAELGFPLSFPIAFDESGSCRVER